MSVSTMRPNGVLRVVAPTETPEAIETRRRGYEAGVFDILRKGLLPAFEFLRFQARWGSGRPDWRAGYCDAILTGVQARMDERGWLARETLEWPEETWT